MFNWQNLKNDNRVKFAFGLAFTLFAVKLLFSDHLLFAIGDLWSAPKEGETKSGVAFAALVPIVVNFAISVFVYIGAWAMNLGETIAGAFQSRLAVASGASPVASSESSSGDSLTKKLVIDFATAAQKNSLSDLESLRIQLRLPQAMDELQDAYRAGDLEGAAVLNTELQALISGPKPLSASAKRKAAQ